MTVTNPAPTPKVSAPRSTIPCHEPATRQPLGEVAVDSPDEVVAIVRRAREAQRAFGEASFATRRRVLERLLDHVLDHADELCSVVVRESGKTREHAMFGEIWPVADKLRWTIRHGERHLRPERVSSGILAHKRARVEYVPLGVVGVICPWNYPLQNVMGPTIAALMAGNGVVIKASEWVAWSTARFQRIFDEALAAEGFSTDLVRIVNGYAETGRALVSSGVDLVIFTGSMPNGRRVVEESAKTLVPVILELGGKDPLIVCDDAHLEQAVHATLAGCFINCGQNCLASERILVFDAVYDDFERRIVQATKALRQGPPLGGSVVDVGAMITPLQLDVVERLVDDAVRRGAHVLTGGKRVLRDQGDFYAPTVLADVTPDMPIMQEEVFGPVMLLCRVRDEEHALEIANGTAFGLASTIMTKSRSRARRMEKRIVAGATGINDFGLNYMIQGLPFGGAKGSGYGRLNGREGLRACTNRKAVIEDRFPMHAPAKVFPVGERDYDVARSVIRAIYGRGLGRKLGALRDLVLRRNVRKDDPLETERSNGRGGDSPKASQGPTRGGVG